MSVSAIELHVKLGDAGPPCHCSQPLWETDWLQGRKYKGEGLFCQYCADVLQRERSHLLLVRRGKRKRKKQNTEKERKKEEGRGKKKVERLANAV